MATYVFLHEPGPDWRQGVAYPEQIGLDKHIAFLRRIAADGRLVMGGPFTDDESGGMVIIEAESLDHARELANQDESIGRLLRVRVRPWRIAMSRIELDTGTSP